MCHSPAAVKREASVEAGDTIAFLYDRSGIVTGHSGIVPTDSGIVTSDSGHPIKLGTMDRNGWARWTGIAGRDGPDSVGTMDRNTHLAAWRSKQQIGSVFHL